MKKLGTTRSLAIILASFALVVGGFGGASKAAREPGLYGGVHYVEWLEDGKIAANVGLPVNWGIYASCVGGNWTFSRAEIVSGVLPPGMRIDPSNYHIVGVPTRAGTWHLRVKFINVRCAGNYYKDNTQDLHITTKGSSAPRRVDR